MLRYALGLVYWNDWIGLDWLGLVLSWVEMNGYENMNGMELIGGFLDWINRLDFWASRIDLDYRMDWIGIDNN